MAKSEKSALKPGRSDRQTLSIMLLSGKLTFDEERAFRSMYNALEAGQLKLTPPQRMWADQIFEKLKLTVESKPSKFKALPAKPVGVGPNPYDTMVQNRPLRPPGKK